MKKLADKYNPKDFEDKLYSEWEEKDILSLVWTSLILHTQ